MRLHANAKLSLEGSELLIDRVLVAGWSLTEAAERPESVTAPRASGVPAIAARVRKGLLDRSSAPATVANRTDARRVDAIAALRRLRITGAKIAEVLCMAHSTVSRRHPAPSRAPLTSRRT